METRYARRLVSDDAQLLAHALETLLQPQSFSLYLRHTCAAIPSSTEAAEAEYLTRCREQRVMPYSGLRFKTHYGDRFRPTTDSLYLIATESHNDLNVIPEGMVSHWRFYEYHFDATEGGGWTQFQETFWPQLRAQHYAVHSGSFEFENDYRNGARVCMQHFRGKAEVQLIIEKSKVVSDAHLDLISWYVGVAARFSQALNQEL